MPDNCVVAGSRRASCAASSDRDGGAAVGKRRPAAATPADRAGPLRLAGVITVARPIRLRVALVVVAATGGGGRLLVRCGRQGRGARPVIRPHGSARRRTDTGSPPGPARWRRRAPTRSARCQKTYVDQAARQRRTAPLPVSPNGRCRRSCCTRRKGRGVRDVDRRRRAAVRTVAAHGVLPRRRRNRARLRHDLAGPGVGRLRRRRPGLSPLQRRRGGRRDDRRRGRRRPATSASSSARSSLLEAAPVRWPDSSTPTASGSPATRSVRSRRWAPGTTPVAPTLGSRRSPSGLASSFRSRAAERWPRWQRPAAPDHSRNRHDTVNYSNGQACTSKLGRPEVLHHAAWRGPRAAHMCKESAHRSPRSSRLRPSTSSTVTSRAIAPASPGCTTWSPPADRPGRLQEEAG